MSHASVTTTSGFGPERTTTLACGSPSEREIPSTVRTASLALKSLAPSIAVWSAVDSRRRTGSATIVLRGRPALVAEDARQAERPAPACRANGVAERAALAHPAVVEGDLLAERAHLDVLVHAVGREAERQLAHEQRALANRALLGLHDTHRLHREIKTTREMQGGFR